MSKFFTIAVTLSLLLRPNHAEAIGSLQQLMMNNIWKSNKGLGVADATTKGNAITSDSAGNIYVVGTTTGGLDGGTLSFAGSTDIFITKYNSSGSKQWTRQYGCSASCTGAGTPSFANYATSDSSGNIYIIGSTKAPTFTAGSLNYSKTGSQDAILLKIDTTGTPLWLAGLGGGGGSTTDSYGGAVDLNNGYVYISGKALGALPGNAQTGSQDPFVAQYSLSGTRNWVKQFGVSTGTIISLGAAVDGSGKVYIGGTTTIALPGKAQSGAIDLWMAQYSTAGNQNWISQLGNAGGTVSQKTYGNPLAVDSNNNAYIIGYINSDLDGHSFSGTSNMFIVKYNSLGIKQGSILIGTTLVIPIGISADKLGNIYISGNSTDATLDGVSLVGSNDGFLTSYDSNLTWRWTRRFGTTSLGGTRFSYAHGNTVHSDGNIFVTGYVQAVNSIFDSTYNVVGATDFFIIKYNRDGVKRGP